MKMEPLFDSFGEDEFSWNIEDRERNESSDGTGRPGANLVGNAIAVWAGLRADPPTMADAAAAFNLAPPLIVEAVQSAYWLYLAGDPNDPATCLIEAEGE